MTRAMTGLLALALLSAISTSAEAQLQLKPLTGKWMLNIPEEPYGPAQWTLTETNGVVAGTAKVTVAPGVDVVGQMSGQKLFAVVYRLNARFAVETDLPGVPDVDVENNAIVVAILGRAYGYAITTVDGVPISSYYKVTGQKK